MIWRSASGVTPVSKRSASSAFNASVGIRVTRLALPQRSPRPFSAPCTCRAPARIGGERIGDRVAGVVVGVDAETFAGNDARDLADDALDLIGQRAAVGVAQHHPARAGVDRGLAQASAYLGLAL